MNWHRARELFIVIALGLVSNFIAAAVLRRFSPYLIMLACAGVTALYYLLATVIWKPLSIANHARIKGWYKSYNDAKPIVKKALSAASSIRMMTIASSAITSDERGEVLDILEGRARDGAGIKILILNPDSKWAADRLSELDSLKPGRFTPESARQKKFANLQTIIARNRALPSNKIKVRLYDARPIWRIYIIDDIALVSSYLSRKKGPESEHLILARGSDLFSTFERVFDTLWDSVETVEVVTTPEPAESEPPRS